MSEWASSEGGGRRRRASGGGEEVQGPFKSEGRPREETFSFQVEGGPRKRKERGRRREGKGREGRRRRRVGGEDETKESRGSRRFVEDGRQRPCFLNLPFSRI